MKAIILAAGVGSRLGNSLPKPLTELISGESILEWQIKMLKSSSCPQIIVVVGFKKELIMEKFPDVLYVYNPDYLKENTSKSLLRALSLIDEDVLWLNGDVVFHPKTIKSILSSKRAAMLVNSSKVGEEEVKYNLNSSGFIKEIAKTVSDPRGEAVGINFFPKESLGMLRDNLRSCKREDYFEYAIQLCIHQGLDVEAVECAEGDCVEIDFPEDLQRANDLVKQWDLT
ncbi:NTP transferase domain-containing protein [Estrella lausannensis]|uniref:UDP-N-acetylglucosamine pyrophosphorylase n=1 Tax=Estrella lausannensis TaxID=483423 RepID=A0A0H5DRK9_9BACT|nr:phosphocholine cytidylyltransferase family protein [Estrella lausannensis]CRX38843.1 UDP-N-acetylglucosamine pyrophosphorylase [Estrella lausannensis]